MSLTKEQAKYRKARRGTGTLYNTAIAYQEYVKTCEAIGVPVLFPSPIQQAQVIQDNKRKRRTKLEIEKDKRK
jgi:hypothetical protein